MAYLIALKLRPFSDYGSLLKLQKIHGVKFLEKYEHRSFSRGFTDYSSDYLFSKDVNNKLLRTNFIWVLNDGTPDAAVVEQEVIYVVFLDPGNFEPHLTFLTVAELNDSQEDKGLKRALFKSFEDHNIEVILNKTVYLASHGVSVNGGGLNFGLITLIKQDFDWVSFIWCFSHRLGLRLKDSLKNFIKLVEEPLTSELKLLAAVLKEIYVFQNNSICSEKVSDIRWIGHKMRANGKLSDKFGVYAVHLGNAIAELRNNVIAPHVRVNTINLPKRMFSFAEHSFSTFYCL